MLNKTQIIFLVLPICYFGVTNTETPENILLIISDDLRTQLNTYLDTLQPKFRNIDKMHTPNIDRLVKESLVFHNAHCQYPLCSPSRTSFLTGRRPDTTRVYDLQSYFRRTGGNFKTIPQFFKENGYFSYGIGKIFHQGQASGYDDPVSWTVRQKNIPQQCCQHLYKQQDMWNAVKKEHLAQKHCSLHDLEVTYEAVNFLQNSSTHSKQKPFFLAVGYRKPHIPFEFPEEFLDYYSWEDVKLPYNRFVPVNFPSRVGWINNRELFRHKWHGDRPEAQSINVNTLKTSLHTLNASVPDAFVKTITRAYYSTVSFVDHQIGIVIKALKKYNLYDSTLVVFMSDHGYHLGDNGFWGKYLNLDLSTKVPLMIRIPGLTENGMVSTELVELVDLYPTLVEAAGFPSMPRCPLKSRTVPFCTEGRSLYNLFRGEKLQDNKDFVLSQAYHDTQDRSMGYSIRDRRYRFTEWLRMEGKTPNWNVTMALELYDYKDNPGETFNTAELPESADLVRMYRKKLRMEFDRSNEEYINRYKDELKEEEKPTNNWERKKTEVYTVIGTTEGDKAVFATSTVLRPKEFLDQKQKKANVDTVIDKTEDDKEFEDRIHRFSDYTNMRINKRGLDRNSLKVVPNRGLEIDNSDYKIYFILSVIIVPLLCYVFFQTQLKKLYKKWTR